MRAKVITSQEKEIKVEDPKTRENRKFRMKVWNDTVRPVFLFHLIFLVRKTTPCVLSIFLHVRRGQQQLFEEGKKLGGLSA